MSSPVDDKVVRGVEALAMAHLNSCHIYICSLHQDKEGLLRESHDPKKEEKIGFSPNDNLNHYQKTMEENIR